MSEMGCAEVVERLPWYVRGTLDAAERSEVERHLNACATCRRELDETRRVAWITSRHLPAGLIADYACGLEIEAGSRQELGLHLRICPSCREEVERALAGVDAPPLPGSRLRASSSKAGWRFLALAAALIACISSGILLWRTPEGKADVVAGGTLVELSPDSARTRSAPDSVVRLDAGHAATLILETNLVTDAKAYRARLLSADGRELAVVSGLEPDRQGAVVLQVPAHAWPSGDHRMTLEASRASGWQEIESYHLSITP